MRACVHVCASERLHTQCQWWLFLLSLQMVFIYSVFLFLFASLNFSQMNRYCFNILNYEQGSTKDTRVPGRANLEERGGQDEGPAHRCASWELGGEPVCKKSPQWAPSKCSSDE